MAKGFDLATKCGDCDSAPACFLTRIPDPAVRDLGVHEGMCQCSKGTVLFREGESPAGIFVLCSGRVELSITSSDGRNLLLQVAHPGEVLGASAVMSGKNYEVRAETAAPSQLIFIRRKDFLRCLRDYTEACVHLVQRLGGDLQGAYDRVRELGMARLRHNGH